MQRKEQTVIREASKSGRVTFAKGDMIIKKERRSTVPSAAELKWPEVIADGTGKSGDRSFTAFGGSGCNVKEER